MRQTYSIGVDGGGSKTELVLLDAGGRRAADLVAEGANPSRAGRTGAAETVRRGLRELAAKAGIRNPGKEITRTLLCMAGSREFWLEFAAELKGWGMTTATNDSDPVLELATGGGEGMVLHAGTGSFVAARDTDRRPHYAGGLGWALDDAGSGWDIGRRGMSRALYQLQGWHAPGALAARLRQTSGRETAEAVLHELYADPENRDRIHAFAPEVFKAAGDGDTHAKEAVEESLRPLVDLACRAAERIGLHDRVPCGLSGPVFRQPLAVSYATSLIKARRPDWEVTPIRERPIEGVIRLLQKNRQGLP